MKLYNRAIASFEQALNLDPKSEASLINKVQIQNLQEAAACYDQVLIFNPHNKTALEKKTNVLNAIFNKSKEQNQSELTSDEESDDLFKGMTQWIVDWLE